MKPLTAWLAMGIVFTDDPVRLMHGEFMVADNQSIVADTPENRERLGMTKKIEN